MDIFFTSDTHFHHKNIINYCNRPFADVEEMNEILIENWNKFVKPSDRIFHLGDFAFCNREKAHEIFSRLNGEKHLVPGNHDPRWIARLGWNSIQKLRTLEIEGRELVMNHFYNLTPKNGQILLHGHAHGNAKKERFKIDVGVDCWNYHPIPLDDIFCVANTWIPKREVVEDFRFDAV